MATVHIPWYRALYLQQEPPPRHAKWRARRTAYDGPADVACDYQGRAQSLITGLLQAGLPLVVPPLLCACGRCIRVLEDPQSSVLATYRCGCGRIFTLDRRPGLPSWQPYKRGVGPDAQEREEAERAYRLDIITQIKRAGYCALAGQAA